MDLDFKFKFRVIAQISKISGWEFLIRVIPETKTGQSIDRVNIAGPISTICTVKQ
jgi:hypothetical protein